MSIFSKNNVDAEIISACPPYCSPIVSDHWYIGAAVYNIFLLQRNNILLQLFVAYRVPWYTKNIIYGSSLIWKIHYPCGQHISLAMLNLHPNGIFTHLFIEGAWIRKTRIFQIIPELYSPIACRYNNVDVYSHLYINKNSHRTLNLSWPSTNRQRPSNKWFHVVTFLC